MKKQCTKCKETKDLKYFGTTKRIRSGYRSWCRKCEREKNQQIRESKEYIRGKHQEIIYGKKFEDYLRS